MFGQVLVYLRDNASLHVGVECVSQFSERLWRRHHDEGLRLARSDHLFHGRCDLSREPMLLDVMPIGRLDSASATCKGSLADPSWPIAALLVGGRIFLLKHLLSPEIWKFRVAIISQEQAFRPSPTNTKALWGIFNMFVRSSEAARRG